MNKSSLYEELILLAYQCKPYDFIGADFKIYRNLSDSENDYFAEKDKNILNSDISKDPIFKHGIQIGRIASYIQEAIAHVLHKHNEILSPIQRELLEVYLDELNDPSKEKIDEIMELAYKIFKDIGLVINHSELNTELSSSQG